VFDADVPVDALKDGAGWDLRQFLRLNLVQASALQAAFRKKLCRRDALQCLKHTRCQIWMVSERFLQGFFGEKSTAPAELSRLTVGKLKASDVLPSHSTLCAWSVRFAFEMALSVGRWNPEAD